MDSDREVILAMLRRSGVVFKGEDDGSISIDVDDQPDGVRKGYHGFLSAFYFSVDESLQTVGAWE